MNEMSLTDTITAMTKPLAASLGLDVWGVDAAFGKRGIIRIYVESDGGVDLIFWQQTGQISPQLVIAEICESGFDAFVNHGREIDTPTGAIAKQLSGILDPGSKCLVVVDRTQASKSAALAPLNHEVASMAIALGGERIEQLQFDQFAPQSGIAVVVLHLHGFRLEDTVSLDTQPTHIQ